LLEQNAVKELRVLKDGRIVSAVVAMHRVYIQYRGATRERMLGECSCGTAPTCVHVAAVDLAVAHAPAARVAMVVGSPSPAGLAAADLRPRRQSLRYVLGPRPRGALEVTLWVCEAPDSTRPPSRFGLRHMAAADDYPRYVTADDRPLLASLRAASGEDAWDLRGASGLELLQRIVATGRARFWSKPERTMSWGPPRPIPCAWTILDDGGQRLDIESAAERHIELVLALEPVAYLDPESGECGLLETAHAHLLRRHWGGAPLSADEAASTHAALVLAAASGAFPRPRALAVTRRSNATLSAALRLESGPTATLYFVYDGCAIPSGALEHDSPFARHFDGESVREFPRDRAAEKGFAALLESVLPAAGATTHAWLDFMQRSVPLLRAAAWRIDVEPSFPFRLAAATDWFGDLRASSRREWFDLRLGIMVDGEAVNLLPELVLYLSAQSSDRGAGTEADYTLVRLADGRYLPVARERIRRIGETLVELFDQDALSASGTLRLPRHQAVRLQDLELGADLGQIRGDDCGLLTLAESRASQVAAEPVDAPLNFGTSLRPYQQEGLAWLQSLRRQRRGGILADDMGLGKTIQTLAHLALEKQQGRQRRPSLIVAPVSLVGNWRREIARFAPDLEVVVSHGAARHELMSRWPRADVVITSYSLLHVDHAALAAQEFYCLILDEAQIIKNPSSNVSRAARALRSTHRLCLTGTPVENHLGELWSLCDFLEPGLLGDQRSFRRLYRTPIEKLGLKTRAAALSRRLAPYVLRRTKDAVARDLPAKMQILEVIRFDDAQRDLYDAVRLAMHRRVQETIARQGLARSRITVLDALLKLRQVCCDPRLVAALSGGAPVTSAKLDWLMSAVPEMISSGRRILVFSQFTSMLRLIATALDARGLAYEMLTGTTRDRAARIDAFQAGTVPIFLLSLKAGGTGLNLTAADTVIHYDPWWNPAVETQATDRAHRIGQDKPIFVYKLIAEASIEEKIVHLQAGKQAILTALYGDGGAHAAGFDAAEVDELLAP
jgi:superfamily II DNA or RNA helicase